ncbi:tetratricopeptide repeat protein [Streptomyces sp. NPDC000410]|uniref:tetratricopeptide repeat protein n=1 Tax=Streptomyces sp. NPDC000410 TaxID=3154254 RepID=UPI00331B3B97
MLAAGLSLPTVLLAVALGVLTIGAALVALRRARARRPGAGHPDTASAAPADSPELPSPVRDFTGRAGDLEELRRLVDDGHRAIVVTGPAGVGKSSLVLRLADELRPRFPDGQLYADLGTDHGDALPSFLAALGASEEEQRGDTPALAARFRGRTARRGILVVLADAADAAQVAPLLPAGEQCLTLITARSLDLPGAASFTLAPLTPQEAPLLWAAAGGHKPPTVAPPDSDLLPLAIRIAAASGQPADRVAAERARLAALGIGDLAIRAAFETGYAALADSDRHLFRSLGAYPCLRLTVPVAAAAADWEQRAARVGLERLAAAQLIRPEGRDTYRIHDLIRRFAAERLEADVSPADRRAALERLLAADPVDPAAIPLLVRAGVREGLHAATYRLAATAEVRLRDEPSQVARIAMWSAVLDAARRSGENGCAAQALRCLGEAYAREGRYDRAIDHLRMSIAVQQRADTRADQMEARRLLGDALHKAGRYDEALRELRTALDVCRALHRPRCEAEILSSLGALHMDRRRPDQAIACLEPAVIALPRCADAERHLGAAYVQTGNLAAAERSLRAALALYGRQNRPVGEGWTLREFGYLEERRGAYGPGAVYHRAALDTFDRVGYGKGVAAAAEAIGDNLLAQGDQAAADAEYHRAAAVYADLGDHVREAEIRRKLSA